MKKVIRIMSVFMAFAGFLCIPANGQDLMARQANMDKQLKAVDSVSLQRSLMREITMPKASDLYSSWDTKTVNPYSNEEKPIYYKIDLRGFAMPTPSRNVTSNYGYRRQFRRQHYGIDVKVYTGDTIYAAFDGKVRIRSYNRRGYGYFYVIRHPNGLETVYGHLSKQFVEQDEIVKAGQPIGLGGNTGNSRGSHLHFETRLLGEPIDPALLFDFANQDVVSDFYVYHNSHPYLATSKKSDSDVELALTDENSAEEEIIKEMTASEPQRPTYYKVKRGDSLYSISKKYGLTIQQLCKINGLSKRSRLRQGQILKCN